jgi:hypothetical protein
MQGSGIWGNLQQTIQNYLESCHQRLYVVKKTNRKSKCCPVNYNPSCWRRPASSKPLKKHGFRISKKRCPE